MSKITDLQKRLDDLQKEYVDIGGYQAYGEITSAILGLLQQSYERISELEGMVDSLGKPTHLNEIKDLKSSPSSGSSVGNEKSEEKKETDSKYLFRTALTDFEDLYKNQSSPKYRAGTYNVDEQRLREFESACRQSTLRNSYNNMIECRLGCRLAEDTKLSEVLSQIKSHMIRTPDGYKKNLIGACIGTLPYLLEKNTNAPQTIRNLDLYSLLNDNWTGILDTYSSFYFDGTGIPDARYIDIAASARKIEDYFISVGVLK
jgi:hypothetical protein